MTAAVIEKVLVLGSMLGLGAVGSYYMITGASDSSLSRSNNLSIKSCLILILILKAKSPRKE